MWRSGLWSRRSFGRPAKISATAVGCPEKTINYMTKLQLYRELESILEIPAQSIRGDEALADFDQWDSLATMGLMTMADEKLGVPLPPAAIAACRSVEDLARLLEPHLEK